MPYMVEQTYHDSVYNITIILFQCFYGLLTRNVRLLNNEFNIFFFDSSFVNLENKEFLVLLHQILDIQYRASGKKVSSSNMSPSKKVLMCVKPNEKKYRFNL